MLTTRRFTRLFPLTALCAMTSLVPAAGCDGVDSEPGPDLDIVTLEARAGDRPTRSWDFGETGVFLESPALGLTIVNESRAVSRRIDVALLGPDAGHFVATGDCKDVFLTSKATCALRVRFQPTAAGVRRATVRVAELDGASVEVQLTGTGTGSGSDPMLTVAPSILDFGTTAVGDEVEDRRDVVIRNASPTDITDLTVVVTGAGFSVEPGGCGTILRAFESCTASIRLTPAALGPVTGTLEVRGGRRMNSVSLLGVGARYVHVGLWTGDGGSGLLTSEPAAFSCDITCSGPFRPCHGVCSAMFTGDAVIIATADPGSYFPMWTRGPCAGSTELRCALAAGLDPVSLGGSWLKIPAPPEPTAPTEVIEPIEE